MRGRVLRVSGQQCLVEVDGRRRSCRMRGRLKSGARAANSPVVAGDWVEVAAGGIIEGVEPRQSHFARPARSSRHYEQIVAANIDQLAIVSAARRPALRPGFIDRAITMALRGHIRPLVVVNKIDLDGSGAARAAVAPYRALCYPLFFTSATHGEGIEAFAAALKDKTTALVGQSGVGKSSLLNCMDPGLGLKTREIMQRHDRGRHTTAAVQLFPLPQGGYVADTPGIKELAVRGLRRAELAHYFVEMAPLVGQCRFRNCIHLNEPHCAVRAAVERGEIAPQRYASYARIIEELPA